MIEIIRTFEDGRQIVSELKPNEKLKLYGDEKEVGLSNALPLIRAAREMYHDLLALGSAVPDEAARMFGKNE